MTRRTRARKGRTVPRKGTPSHLLSGNFSIEKLRKELSAERTQEES